MSSEQLADSPLNPSLTQANQRITAIDLTRGWAVIIMVLVHTHDLYGNESTHDLGTAFGLFMGFFSLGAPVFLLAMGMSFAFSRKQSLASALLRGLLLVGMAYVMNFLWFVLPLMAGVLPENFLAANEWPKQLDSITQLLRIVSLGDILHMAGLSIILLGLVRYSIKKSYAIFVVALLVATLSAFIQGYRPGIPYIDGLCDLLWGIEWNVYFPLIPWAAPSIFGLALGVYIKECDGNTQALFNRLLPLGALLTITGGLLWLYKPELHFRDFFHMGPGVAIHLMGLSALFFWLFSKQEGTITTRFIGRLFIYCSHRVTSIYLLHIFLIVWGMMIFGFKQQATIVVIAASALAFGLSLAIDYLVRSGISSLRQSRIVMKNKTVLPTH